MKQIRSRLVSLLALLCIPGMTVCAEPDETTAAETQTTEETTTTATTADVRSKLTYEETPTGSLRITGFAWTDERRVELPAVIGGKTVTEIGQYAMEYCFADEIILPGSLLYIADSAFAQCAYVKKLTVPTGCRYIGEKAFQDCSALEEVVIPQTVTDIGCMAFDGTPFYRNLTGDLAIFGDGVLYAWRGDGSTLEIPDTVKTVAPFACSNHPALTSVTVSDSVTRVQDCAFGNCPALSQVTFEGQPDEIAADAFADTKWYTEPASDFLMIGDMLYAYRGKDSTVTVPDGVRIINTSAFEWNTDVASLTLPDSVEEIGRAAFWRCEGLQAAALGNVKHIGESAFYGCQALRDLRLGNSLESLGDCALAGTALRTVSLPDTTEQIGTMAIGYFYSPERNQYEKQTDAPTLYSNTEAAAAYAKANGLQLEPLPEEENTEPLAEITTTESEPQGFTGPTGTAWIPAVLSGGALVLLALIVLIIRRIVRK